MLLDVLWQHTKPSRGHNVITACTRCPLIFFSDALKWLNLLQQCTCFVKRACKSEMLLDFVRGSNIWQSWRQVSNPLRSISCQVCVWVIHWGLHPALQARCKVSDSVGNAIGVCHSFFNCSKLTVKFSICKSQQSFEWKCTIHANCSDLHLHLHSRKTLDNLSSFCKATLRPVCTLPQWFSCFCSTLSCSGCSKSGLGGILWESAKRKRQSAERRREKLGETSHIGQPGCGWEWVRK